MTYEDAFTREVAQWPGVVLSFGMGGKHARATVEYAGQSRFLVYPLSPSDSARGVANAIGGLRRELRAMGARRETLERSERPVRLWRRREERAVVAKPLAETRPTLGEQLDRLALTFTAVRDSRQP